MKKTLRSLKLACLAAVSMLVVSCGGSADYRNFLPADSFMTMSVNPASLLQKSDAGDIGQHPLFIRLKAELDKAEGITAEEKEYLLALLKNPCESGVDLKKDLFFFMSMDGAMQSPNVRGPSATRRNWTPCLHASARKAALHPGTRAVFRSSHWARTAP